MRIPQVDGSHYCFLLNFTSDVEVCNVRDVIALTIIRYTYHRYEIRYFIYRTGYIGVLTVSRKKDIFTRVAKLLADNALPTASFVER